MQYPQIFGTDIKNIQSKFNDNFKTIFFKHLHEVITANTITLEIDTCKLKCIISTTESLLIECNESIQAIQQQYHRFITTTEIKDHVMNPALFRKIQHIPTTQTSPAITKTSPTNT